MKKMVLVRVDRCLGCRSCELACAVEHSSTKDLQRLVQSDEKPGNRINVESYGPKAVPIHCHHCEEAACIMACPTGAISRKSDDDPVVVDKERCIGCKMCVQACPFGVITINPNGKGVLKCDLCIERLAEGKNPACVSACPTKALTYGEEKEVSRAKRKKAAAQIATAQEQATEA